MANRQDTATGKKQTPEDVRQQMLAHLETNKKALNELNEEELESIVGGHAHRNQAWFTGDVNNNNVGNSTKANSQSIAVGNSTVNF